MQAFSLQELGTADLVVDATYRGGRTGHAGDDPFSLLLSVSNMGGFRYRGNLDRLEMVVLTSSMNDPDWPDSLDQETGVFTYYGDNKKPGRALHDTPRNGNDLLRRVFQLAHEGSPGRQTSRRSSSSPIPASGGTSSFSASAVPGTSDLRSSEDLVAIWKSAAGRRFQNYRARLTVLNAPVVSRAWISDVLEARPHTSNAQPRGCVGSRRDNSARLRPSDRLSTALGPSSCPATRKASPPCARSTPTSPSGHTRSKPAQQRSPSSCSRTSLRWI